MTADIQRYALGRFPTQVLRSRSVASVLLTETAYAPSARLSWHVHDLPCLVFVIEGTFTEMTETARRHCRPSTLIVRPAGERHVDDFTTAGARCLNVELPADSLGRMTQGRVTLSSEVLSAGPAVSVATRLHAEFLRSDGPSRLAMEGLLLELTAEIARLSVAETSVQPARWLRQVREAVDEHPGSPWTMAGLASEIGVSPIRLARSFRRAYGCSLRSYLLQRRIDLSRREILRSEQTLAEISIRAGFYDQSHFTNAFRKATGITPHAYRVSQRGGSLSPMACGSSKTRERDRR